VTLTPPLSPYPRKAGRPYGSKDRVIKSEKLGLHHFACVRGYLQGLEPLAATRRYLMDEETPASSESAYTTVLRLMQWMSNAAGARLPDPNKHEEHASLLRSKEALDRAVAATRTLQVELRADKLRKAKETLQRQEAKARELGLQFVPKNQLPSPPDYLQGLNTFEDWYDRKYQPDELPDTQEMRSLMQEHLSDWYAEQGFYVPVDLGHLRHAHSETIPMGALHIAASTRSPSIDPSIRASAAKHLEPLLQLVNRRPQPSDEIGAWISGTTHIALRNADIRTLYTLGSFIKRHGLNWHRKVPALGPVRAKRLQTWLVEMQIPHLHIDASTLQSVEKRRDEEVATFKNSQNIPPALFQLGLEPLFPYVGSSMLDGRDGIFRRDGPNMLKADNDLDALVTTLNKYKDRSQTLKVYAREMCRFCLWAYEIKKLPLSSLGVDDAREYKEFINAVPADWTSPPGESPPRGSRDWRPFRGSLDASSQRKALTAINVVMGQMLSGGYLIGNPMAGVLKQSGLAKPKMDVMRSFSAQQWDLINKVMEEEPPSPAARRTYAMVNLLYTTGMRRDELYKARLGHIEKTRIDGENALLLTVVGKGSKERRVLIPPEVMDMVESHLADRAGLFVDDMTNQEGRNRIPLVSAIQKPVKRQKQGSGPDANELMFSTSDGALSPDAMRLALKRLLTKCRDRAMESGLDKSAFELATLHWLRHTFGHSMADASVDLRVLQKAMGHSNINTTAHYSKAELNQMVRGLRDGRAIAMAQSEQIALDADKRGLLASPPEAPKP
jgi:site-specific recombinase XerD